MSNAYRAPSWRIAQRQPGPCTVHGPDSRVVAKMNAKLEGERIANMPGLLGPVDTHLRHIERAADATLSHWWFCEYRVIDWHGRVVASLGDCTADYALDVRDAVNALLWADMAVRPIPVCSLADRGAWVRS